MSRGGSLRRPAMRLAAVIVVASSTFASGSSLASSDEQHVAPSDPLRLSVRGNFLHGQPNDASSYGSALMGEVEAAFVDLDGKTGRLHLPVGLGDTACRLSTMWWAVDGKNTVPTGPLGSCLVAAGADQGFLDDWIAGKEAADPSLVITLSRVPQTNMWTNSQPVAAALFVERCDKVRAEHVRYVDVSADPGALSWRTDGGASTLAIEGVQVGKTNPALWDEVREGCGNDGVPLPDTPSDGVAAKLSGSDAPAVPGVQGGLDGLRTRLSASTAARELTRDVASNLVQWLDGAALRATSGDPDKTALDLGRFMHSVELARGRGEIDPKLADLLAQDAGRLRTGIATRASISTPPPDPAECPDRAPVAYTTFHVDDVAASGDGSSGAPFATIGEALAEASRRESPGVEVIVRPGTYLISTAIDRPTRIAGPVSAKSDRPILVGWIINNTGSLLELRNLVMSEGDASAAIAVDHPCARTNIERVGIRDAQRHGVWHRGGTLQLHDVAIHRVRATPTFDSGVAIRLGEGVDARITRGEFDHNEAGAIVAEGLETRVVADAVTVSDTGSNPYINPCPMDVPATGAVVARAGARIDLWFAAVTRSDFFGVYADNAAVMNLENTAVNTTAGLTEPGGRFCGGTNIMSTGEAQVTLTAFRSDDAASSGLLVGSDAGMDASYGFVTRNAIGASVLEDEFDLRRLTNEVRFEDNEINLSMTRLPVPRR